MASSRARISSRVKGGTAHYAPYVASKWAIRGLTQTAALELGRDLIRVNTTHPGVISTSFIHEPAAGAVAAIADRNTSRALGPSPRPSWW
ncbi:SDR family NAD(P)-dependent oxidoreductase [Streptomyces sp. NPDC010273]|uniref:SDR family NAD(P)-dependent oxidoreductase n=1 Tax=Streptomyces sp. NPDC010273 TaxID=3364829 RepID=UPI0036E20BE0